MPNPANANPSLSAGDGTPPPPKKKLSRPKLAAIIVASFLVLLLAWPIGLLIWANGHIEHVAALSGAPNTPGTTWLIAGSDARGSGGVEVADDVSGQRSDTIMVLHRPSSGPTALISIPRDSFVEIPGHNASKINASFAWGGPQLLVETVEKLSGLTIDHYVEVGFGGVVDVVDAIGTVNLCSDLTVDEPHSGLKWEPGCHDVDGKTALAFARMRYQDPQGDIGRAERQQQVIGAIGREVANAGTLFNPGEQIGLLRAGVGALAIDDDSNILDLGQMAWAFTRASGANGIKGTPPLGSLNYHGGSVQLDPDLGPQFWKDIEQGNLPPGPVGGWPQ
ncbi:MAG: LCP family protein [Cellulomonadaceae bacterium]|nr:LCP family protein [Cellulomonadaceae bacterium]